MHKTDTRTCYVVSYLYTITMLNIIFSKLSKTCNSFEDKINYNNLKFIPENREIPYNLI